MFGREYYPSVPEETDKKGRVMKVFFADSSKNIIGETGSLQLPEDDFRTMYGSDLQEPPFSLEQMVFLAEQHPIHNAAIEQKAADVIGMGWEWKQTNEDGKSENESERDSLEDWFMGLTDERRDETMHEILLNAWNDVETVGHGLIEVARDPGGKVKYCYPMPAHTCRFARDGIRICQIRNGKKVWFKRWVPDDEQVVSMSGGHVYDSKKAVRKGERTANEVLVIKKPARRSTWYGIPTYVSALGWIVLSTLARDDNIYYFENRREPRWAIILTNMDDDPDIEESLKQALQVDLKQPHRNIVIPVEGPGNIEFKQLSDLKTEDMSFEKLQERSGTYILVGHKMPSDRLGLSKVGPLGGTVAIDASRVYKEGVVQTSQAVLNARINRFIKWESGIKSPTMKAKKQKTEWLWACKELDLTEEGADMTWATTTFQAGLVTLNEGRRKLGEPELQNDERGDMFITELAQWSQKQAAGEGQQLDANGNPVDENGQPLTPEQQQQQDQLKQSDKQGQDEEKPVPA